MQFALPPRRSPHPHPYARPSRISFQRKQQLKTVAILAFAVIALYLILSRLTSTGSTSAAVPVGTTGVVIVTVIDRAALSESYIQKIVKNREDYAKRHGYTNFFADVADYETSIGNSPRSWATVPAVRHAMATYPHSSHFFHLSPHALIMNPSQSFKSQLLDKNRLEPLMLKDVSVVPPDSIIKTFSHLKAHDIDLVLSTDLESLSSESFVLRQGEFARFFLDLWFDPLFRQYNFAKAETHALDHIVQWHPTILARLALVPQRVLNAYSKDSKGAALDGTYNEGDFVIRFYGCDIDPTRSCEKEMEPYYNSWARKLAHQ